MLPRFSSPWSFALCLICAVGLIGCSDESDTTGDVAKSREKSQALVPEAPAGTTALGGATNLVVKGNIFPVGDTDLYSFTGTAGDRIYVATQTAGSAASSTGNTTISILDTDAATPLETDDDDGAFNPGSSSIAGFTLPATGTYFVSVSVPGAGLTPVALPYHLHFQRRTGAPVAEVETNDATPQALPGGWVAGALANAGDIDLYSLSLNAGDTVFASLDTRAGDWDADLGIGPFAGGTLFENDGGNAGPNSHAHFITVKTAGTYTIRVDSDGGDSGAYNLNVSVHPAAPKTGCVTYTNSTPVALPDGLTTSTVSVPDNVFIEDIDVNVNITHAQTPQLDVHLVAPGGNVVGLFTDVGSGATPNVDVTVDDEAALPMGLFGVTTGMISQPENAYRLDWFDGQPAQGTWTLRVVDDAGGTTGTLNSWGVTICPRPAAPVCPAGTSSSVVFTTDFEASDAGFTHSGTADEWARGTPTGAPIDSCNSGTNCFKTDLTGSYENNSNQNLLSPAVSLSGVLAPITLNWAQKFQLEAAMWDHASVDVRNVDDSSPTRLFEHLGPSGTDNQVAPTAQMSAGWARHTANISSYAGNSIEVLFHVDTDASVIMDGMAVDDVSVTGCRIVCGDGQVGAGEQCDDSNTTPGDCCSATCQFEALGSTCLDATVCNGAEACNGAGACIAGTPLVTDDTNVCTTDACDPVTGVTHTPVTNGNACADSTVCNGAETCQAGICEPGTPLPVDDSNPCTADACDPVTGATHTPVTDGTACLDTTVCNGAEACQAGICMPGTALPLDDLNVCTADACDPVTGVSHTAVTNGTSCADGTVCNGAETCQVGVCSPGTALPLDDSNPCTADSCDAVSGVAHTPVTNGTACADSTVCNGAETCQTGTCTAGTALPVDDSNVCTTDACDPVAGVTHTPVTVGTACPDADLCNGGETCNAAGTCVAGTPPTVDDSNVCTTDACTAGGGVTHTPVTVGTACPDGNLCNGGETCNAAGTCAAGTPPVVDDNNVCTTDACTAGGGVTHTPVTVGTACPDGNLCNGGETCNAAGTCAAGTPPVVDDNNVCTTDACLPATGVSNTPVAAGTACPDADLCNGGETCNAGGTCVAGTPPTVDDGNPCTADACTAGGGVTHTPVTVGTACDDSTQCNGRETCNAAGACVAGTAPDCTPGDECHSGMCDPATGQCSNPTLPDGTVCTGGMCVSGTCVGGGGSGGGGGAGGAAGSGGAAGGGGVAGAAGSGGAAGAAGSGGATAGSGGSAGRGGSSGSGGSSNGGTPSGGTATGGAAGDGAAGEDGEAGEGGVPSTGGSATGGAAGRGGAVTGGTAGMDMGGEGGEGTPPRPRRKAISDEESGCGCVVPGKTSQSGLPLLLGLALTAFAVRRRRAKRAA